MKAFLRQLFSPLLTPLERGDHAFDYKPSQRYALLFISVVFVGLASLIVRLMPAEDGSGYWFPAIVFGVIGIGGVIVGSLGSDRAVAKIWGTK